MPRVNKDPQDYIVPLYMNGLHGRMMHLPAAKPNRKREILLIYGMHANLERYFTLAQCLQDYGSVTLPDLPGHGGMESFYKIGEKPTLDNLADYLAAFIKLRYKKRRITIAGMSLGFVIVTRMLQKYPDIARRVDLVISVVGFTHKDDFRLKKHTTLSLKAGSSIFMRRVPAVFFRHVILHRLAIWSVYSVMGNKHAKMKNASKAERRRRIEYEIKLWHDNDVRTYMTTALTMLMLDLTRQQIPLPVYHISVDADQYFDNRVVEQHMRCIYTDFVEAKAHLPNHAPTIISDIEEAGAIFPPLIRELLAKPV